MELIINHGWLLFKMSTRGKKVKPKLSDFQVYRRYKGEVVSL